VHFSFPAMLFPCYLPLDAPARAAAGDLLPGSVQRGRFHTLEPLPFKCVMARVRTVRIINVPAKPFQHKLPKLSHVLLPTGDTFVAVLGGGQSSLEALLLKRRIKGPCWLRLSQPERVADASRQVRLAS